MPNNSKSDWWEYDSTNNFDALLWQRLTQCANNKQNIVILTRYYINIVISLNLSSDSIPFVKSYIPASPHYVYKQRQLCIEEYLKLKKQRCTLTSKPSVHNVPKCSEAREILIFKRFSSLNFFLVE